MQQAQAARAIISETSTEPAEEEAIAPKSGEAHNEAPILLSSGPEDCRLDWLGTEVDIPTDC
jgi:hypothetical protein